MIQSMILYDLFNAPCKTAINTAFLWSPVSMWSAVSDDLCFWFPSSQKELNNCWIKTPGFGSVVPQAAALNGEDQNGLVHAMHIA